MSLLRQIERLKVIPPQIPNINILNSTINNILTKETKEYLKLYKEYFNNKNKFIKKINFKKKV